jgi:hypothetical protein
MLVSVVLKPAAWRGTEFMLFRGGCSVQQSRSKSALCLAATHRGSLCFGHQLCCLQVQALALLACVCRRSHVRTQIHGMLRQCLQHIQPCKPDAWGILQVRSTLRVLQFSCRDEHLYVCWRFSINQFMWLDFAINMGLGYCMTAAAPSASLTRHTPPTSIFTAYFFPPFHCFQSHRHLQPRYTLCSMALPNLWAIVIMFVSSSLLQRQSFFSPFSGTYSDGSSFPIDASAQVRCLHQPRARAVWSMLPQGLLSQNYETTVCDGSALHSLAA